MKDGLVVQVLKLRFQHQLFLAVAVDGLVHRRQLHLQRVQRLEVGLQLFRQAALVFRLELGDVAVQPCPGSPWPTSARRSETLVVRLAWFRCTVMFCSVNLVTSSRTTACAL